MTMSMMLMLMLIADVDDGAKPLFKHLMCAAFEKCVFTKINCGEEGNTRRKLPAHCTATLFL